MRLLNPVTHRQRTKSANVPEINPEAGGPRYLSDCSLARSMSVNETLRQSSVWLPVLGQGFLPRAETVALEQLFLHHHRKGN